MTTPPPVIPSSAGATVQPLPGLTLERYALAKGLPLAFLAGLGLSDTHLPGSRIPAVRMPYPGIDGRPSTAVRFRCALVGPDRFRWNAGAKPIPYGLDRLADARAHKTLAIVEGESDAHSLWFHGVPALGLPGAASLKPEWLAHFEGIATIYVVIEPDAGGPQLLATLAAQPRAFRERLALVRLPGFKDPSAMHVDDPNSFLDRWTEATIAAEPWARYEAAQRTADASQAWEACAALATAPDILHELDRSLDERGVAGERRAARLLYLAVTSRFFERPVSVAVKGPSSGGKSFVLKEVLRHFPAESFYELTAMSDRALAYGDEPLANRMLVVYEAGGLAGEIASYLVRSLLSEGRICYETVQKTSEGLQAVRIDREGPTGLLTTTTQAMLHAENETRVVSVPVNDTPAQTARVLQSLARLAAAPHDHTSPPGDDMTAWHGLQRYLAASRSRVVVPFAVPLAQLIPPVAVRLRRDLTTLLSLVRAHALLHAANRTRTTDGDLVATVRDYAVVRELVADLFETGAQMTVSPTVRETVQAIAALCVEAGATSAVSATRVACRLGLDKSATSRRLRVAIAEHFLVNNESRRGRPMQLVLGDPLPEDQRLLPTAEGLAKAISDADGVASAELPPGWLLRNNPSELHGCTVAGGDAGEGPVSGRF